MRILGTRRLRGPNVHLTRPVMVARVHLDDLADRHSAELDGFNRRLLDVLPGLAEHHCAAGAPGGFVARLEDGTYFGHVGEHVTLELSTRLGRPVSFGRTLEADEPGLYDVITECPQDEAFDSDLPRLLLQAAIDVVRRVVDGDVPDCGEYLSTLRDEHERASPGPSAAAIAAAARARGIPVEWIGGSGLMRLGHGVHSRRTWSAMTDQTSAVGLELAGDKQLTRQILADAGIPVPFGGSAANAEEAVEVFLGLDPPVVVKPRAGNQGKHVYLGLRDAEAVRTAYRAVAATGSEVVVEEQFDGVDYRVLVVGGRVVAAARRLPAHVIGDGSTDVAGLVAAANSDPRRGPGHEKPLTRLMLDDAAAATLARHGYLPTSVPQAGETVWLRDNANLSTGGTAVDVTEQLHPDVADLCQRAAALVGLDIVGVDLRLPDVTVPPATGGTSANGGIIEANAVPGLRMHLEPTGGTARDVGGAIVEALYPNGDGRIPTVAVTGTNGKTTTARLIAHLLGAAGRNVGLTTTDGVYIGGRLMRHGDNTGPRSAQFVLGDPTVDAAVLETARGGIMRDGLGYDWTDVGVITNVTEDHLGQDGLRTVEDILRVKALVAERIRDGGTLVLNADNAILHTVVEQPLTRAAHKRIVWFSQSPDTDVIARHLAAGGLAYLLKEGWLVETDGERETWLLRVSDLPGGYGGAARHAADNALAAAAAARALGVSCTLLVEGLKSFQPHQHNPGRGMLYRHTKASFVVDYAHNPAAIRAVIDTLRRLRPAHRTLAVVTLPGDRTDELLVESAGIIADGFDRIVLYEDADRRGREPGEVPDLLRRKIEQTRPDVRCARAETVAEAVTTALDMAEQDDLILVLYEKAEYVLDALRAVDALPEPAQAVP